MKNRKAIEIALKRRFGSPETTQRLKIVSASQTDWRATCRKCGHTRHGTPADLSAPCPRCSHGPG